MHSIALYNYVIKTLNTWGRNFVFVSVNLLSRTCRIIIRWQNFIIFIFFFLIYLCFIWLIVVILYRTNILFYNISLYFNYLFWFLVISLIMHNDISYKHINYISPLITSIKLGNYLLIHSRNSTPITIFIQIFHFLFVLFSFLFLTISNTISISYNGNRL